MLVQVVEDDLGDRVALEVDDQSLADPGRGLVPDVGDTGDLVVSYQLGDLLGEVVRVHLVRQLGDDELGLPLFSSTLTTARMRMLPRPVRYASSMPVRPTISPPVGKSGPLTRPSSASSSLLVGGVGVVEHPLDAGRDLAQVVRRDVRRHADRDAARAVDQQVRKAARQHQRLRSTGRRSSARSRPSPGRCRGASPSASGGHAGLGVPHGGRRVVARRTEVAVAVDERVAQRPGLREPDQGVVDRGVAVGVVVTHDVTDDAGALEVAAVGAVTAVVHRVEDPAVDGLEPVSDLRQRPPDDDRHGVVEVRPLHLDFDADRLDAVAGRWG